MITQIPPEHLDLIPHRAVFDLLQAMEYSRGERSLVQLIEEIHNGTVQIWIIHDDEEEHAGTVVTRLFEFDSGKKSCIIEYFGGLPGKALLTLDNIKYIEEWARFNGCSDVRVIGRKAWERELKGFGYGKYYTILGKEL